MDQTFVNWGFTVLGGLAVYILYGLRDENKARKDENTKLAERIGQLHANIVRDYVRRDDFKDLADSLFTLLRRIEDKLERKADRS